jgi:hypothetical protein
MPFFGIHNGLTRRYASPLVFLMAGVMGCYLTGCTKPGEEITPRVDTLPTPMGPTGNIKEFTIQDSLIGYKRQSIVKWNVTEANAKTVVTLNGVKVALYGGVQTGQLIANSTFTLMVNNGKTLTRAILVADSLSTYLWNDGQRWMPTDVLKDTTYYLKDQQQRDSLVTGFVSIFSRNTNADMFSHQRLSFYLDHTWKEEQLSTNYPRPNPANGSYQAFPRRVPSDELFMIWKNNYYWIEFISDQKMTIRFDSPASAGPRVTTRIQYIPEY